MTYSNFRNTVMAGFTTGFTVARPSFPVENILYGRTSKQRPPENQTYIRVVYADLGGEFFSIGRAVEQTALLTVDIYVPEVGDLNECEEIADDVLEVIKFLVLPNSGRKSRLSKRDFENSLSGMAHVRVSVTLRYHV